MKNSCKILIIWIGILFCAGCSGDEYQNTYSDDVFDGSEESIQNFVRPELLGIMTGLGLQIHPGNFPPFVNGEYLASTLKLYASNIDSDVTNSIFADTYFKFRNQNRQNLMIELEYITANGSEFSRGNTSVIAGSGDFFTVFAKQKITEDEGSADSIIIVSGKITPAGISDFQFAIFISDNHGIPGFIENNHGRLFYDADNLAAKQ